MYPTYRDSTLWKTGLASHEGHTDQQATRQRLVVAFEQFRDGALKLAEEIPRDLPELTEHSVRHLDALWHIASVIAGPTYPITPLETFILGGAILLHDLGNSLVAFPNRIDDLKGDEWNDLIVSIFLSSHARRPTVDELKNPPDQILREVIFARLRELHSSAAQQLATQGFVIHNDGTSQQVYLLEDNELRDAFGTLIGRIANSHHWSVQRVEDEFASFKVGGTAWHGWDIDALKIACLLRCADAAHLDMHRASTLQLALRLPTGESKKHWTFQNRLHPPIVNETTGELEFRSTMPFGREIREAWWLGFDMARSTVHYELSAVTRVLRRNRRKPFAADGVVGVDSPENFSKYVETTNWQPVDIAVRITDVASVIERFGGSQLYGSDLRAPLRELIANAADAVRARRHLPDGGLGEQQGQIVVRLGKAPEGPWLEVEDEGIGMSEDVLRGPLLDFGTTFWGSALAIQQFPGLMSSQFQPTGKFGIGFFSIFMLGDHVKVTTRRYDGAKLDTQVLEIMRGLKYPMLRRPDSGASDELVVRGGTRVRVRLDADPWTKEGLVGEMPQASSESDTTEQKLSRLRDLVSRLAPSLDVDLWVEIGDDEPKRVQAVRAGDWETMDFEHLLHRVGERMGYAHTRLTDYVCEPQSAGRLLGRFRLTPDRGFGGFRNTMTIGGLAAKWGSKFLEGIVVGGQPRLDRTDGSPLLTDEELRDELRKAVDAGFLPKHPPSPSVASYLLQKGIVPRGLRCFMTDAGVLDPEGLAAWACRVEAGEALVIVEDDTFEFEDELGGNNDYSLDEVWDVVTIEEPYLVIARGDRFGDSRNRNWSLMEDIDTDWDPNTGRAITLLEFGVLTACRVWGVSVHDLEHDLDQREVGHISLRDGSVYSVTLNCCRVVRPEP